MELTLTLAQARRMYEDHFKTELPATLPYKTAAGMVFAEIGKDEFIARYSRLDLDGNYKKQYTIYKDRENAGDHYTVYDNDLDDCLGQFLGDEPEFQTYLAAGEIVDGLDNRS